MISFFKSDGRRLLVVAILFYVAILFVGPAASHTPLTKFWRHLGVDALDPRFIDMKVIIIGTDNVRAGYEPWKHERVDDVDYVFNYPKWWLYTDKLGLNANTLNSFGIGLAALFLVTFVFVVGKITLEEGFWTSLFVLSPCVMLGVERGNIDLVMFVLLAVSLAIRRRVPFSILIMIFAAMLKIFPVFGFLAFVAPPWRKTLPWLSAAIVISLIYFVLNRDELAHIAALTPHWPYRSYGSNALFMVIHDSWRSARMLILADAFLLAAVALSFWLAPKVPSSVENGAERELFAFRIGAGVYLGTFALGTNWDYRLVFLAFCLPLLFRLRKKIGNLQTWANACLALILVYSNWDFFSSEGDGRHLLIKAVLSWGLVCTLSGIWAATLDCRSLFKQAYVKTPSANEVAPRAR